MAIQKCPKPIERGEYYRGDFNTDTGKQYIQKIYICSKDKFKGYDKDYFDNPSKSNLMTFPEDHGYEI